jgi:hypothetical protein
MAPSRSTSCTIDLSADAFYAIGANYTVVLSAATIDGLAINAVLAHFSIENRFANVPALGTVSADVVSVNSSAPAAVNLALGANAMVPGTVDDTAVAPTATTFEADDITEATADHYIGRVVIWTSGALLAQAVEILDYAINGGRGAFTVSTMTDTPANNDTFIIV